MITVAQVLRSKGDSIVHTVTPTTSVFEAIAEMAEKNIGALLVMEAGMIVGIVTERDYARKIVLQGKLSKETKVRDIMSWPVMYVEPQQSNEECMALMTEKRLRHLPVLDQGELVGLISSGDLVKEIISEQSFIIDQLVHYIAG